MKRVISEMWSVAFSKECYLSRRVTIYIRLHRNFELFCRHGGILEISLATKMTTSQSQCLSARKQNIQQENVLQLPRAQSPTVQLVYLYNYRQFTSFKRWHFSISERTRLISVIKVSKRNDWLESTFFHSFPLNHLSNGKLL